MKMLEALDSARWYSNWFASVLWAVYAFAMDGLPVASDGGGRARVLVNDKAGEKELPKHWGTFPRDGRILSALGTLVVAY